MHPFGDLGPNAPLIGRPGSRSALSTPALVLDLDRFERNVAYLADYLKNAGHGLRPVAKIHKSVAVAKAQMEAGALGLCCATLAEAEVMADAGISGVLLFSQVVTEPKIARLAALNARADDLLVAVDDAAVVDALAVAARDTGRPLRMLVDLEVGGRRTGLTSVEAALALARHIAETDGALYAGVQGYNGSFQREPDFAVRAARQAQCTAPLATLCERLAAADLAPEIVSGGGTGTYAIDVGAGLFTECQAGSYIFMDVNYADTPFEPENPHPFETSLFVRTTVISTRSAFVVTDAGIKEFAREDLAPRIASGADEASLYELVGDDLGRVTVPDGARPPEVGEALECITPHCYGTLNLYNVYHCVRGDTLVDIWPIDARAQW
jgi:D-serine deaminase-like pyridoxal phosphate-dependent protein